MLAKFTLILAVIIGFNSYGVSQEICRRTLEEAPSVFGLKLGMTFEQMQGVLGNSFKFKPKKTGEGSYFQNFIDRPSPAAIPGVRAFYLRFFDQKLYQIEIFFEDKGNPPSLQDFLAGLSVDLGITPTHWVIKDGKAQMNCGDFVVEADVPLNPRLQITDRVAASDFAKKLVDAKQPKKKPG